MHLVQQSISTQHAFVTNILLPLVSAGALLQKGGAQTSQPVLCQVCA